MLKFLLLLAVATQAWAEPPRAPAVVVAQALSDWGTRITLTVEDCGWGTGSMRVYQHGVNVPLFGTVGLEWGCWGYNESGVQIRWDSGRQVFLDYLSLWGPGVALPQQMGYQTLYRRVWLLRNTQ